MLERRAGGIEQRTVPKAAGAAGLMPAAGAHASGSRKRYAAVHHNGAHLNDWLTAPVRIEIP